ncbi:hypothetical protein DFP73DRAFT_485907 [Morchella snyderi]|nr:hypothetical protein DFP73DRAFT_485907 [Morchella snyderi]
MGQHMSITSFPPLNLGLSAFPTRKKASPKTAMKSSESTTSAGGKLKKIVRFLEQVEFLPSSGPSFTPHYTYDDEEDGAGFRQSNKKQRTRSPTNDYENIRDDPAINSGLGRAGSPNRSPNRSPNSSSKHLPMPVIEVDNDYLSPPQEFYFSSSPPSSPPSWRIPPSSLIGRQPHVQEPPRVRSPRQEGEEIDLMAHGDKPARDSGIYMDYSDDSDSEQHNGQLPSPPSSPHPPTIHPVIARKMWPHGEIRFEDQWGRRLVPAGQRDSFRFDLWPVEEDVNGEGVGANAKGAWVGRFRGMSRD